MVLRLPFLVELEFGKVYLGPGSLKGGGNRNTGQKPLGARERTNNKLKPHMTSTPAVELRVTSLAGSFPLQVGGESSLDVEFVDKILTFDYIFKFILGSEA